MRRYTDTRLDDLRVMHAREIEALQAQIDRRVGEANHLTELRFTQMDERLDRMNEIRDAMRDQAIRLLGRAEFDATMISLEGRLGKIEAMQERQRGRMAAYSAVSGLIFVALAILTLVLDHVRL